MKRQWETEELIEHWTLNVEELALLGNKTGATRLGFAVLLKFLQKEARFPVYKNEVPGAVITYLATQARVPAESYLQYDWQGRSIKTIFICEYLQSEALRREIHEGLNVVENWNSANSFIFYGRNGKISTNRLDSQEIAVLSLHLLQISMVFINTLMLQEVLGKPSWEKKLTQEDYRGLTPLFYGHINPYGTIHLDVTERLKLEPILLEA